MDAEAALWADYFATRSDEARNRLVEHFLAFAHSAATRLRQKLAHNHDWDIDDLKSWAATGLLQSIAGFDPSRGTKFTSFAMQRINGAMFDGLRDIDTVPRLVRSREKAGVETARTTTSWEAIRAACRWDNDDTEPADTREDAWRRKADDLAFWQETLLGRSNVERIVLLLYYRESLTMKEIAKSLGLSESRVSQIHSALMITLRERLAARLPHLVPRERPPRAPDPIEEPLPMPTSTPAALPAEEGQRPGLKFLLSETTPDSIKQQIDLHEAAILDHLREIRAWQALLECLQTLELQPVTQPPLAAQPTAATGPKCTLAAVTGVFQRAGKPLSPAEIAAQLVCSKVSVSQCLSRYTDNFERVERGLYRLKAA